MRQYLVAQYGKNLYFLLLFTLPGSLVRTTFHLVLTEIKASKVQVGDCRRGQNLLRNQIPWTQLVAGPAGEFSHFRGEDKVVIFIQNIKRTENGITAGKVMFN